MNFEETHDGGNPNFESVVNAILFLAPKESVMRNGVLLVLAVAVGTVGTPGENQIEDAIGR